ncbi:MAG: hypothetical protein KZQ88_17785 [Candidatus Thiodiazotropha sp. (ex Dulcina madagascariensis)]|nr:hypothetical protein [Candidatus Thiodiazotropha sp. (ex Dulcina madagascariensis)]MCU7925971.1 hypothetical protein [Candidatus Thiodiazotropha sp. (ex Dulcina madagascariensis)]
MPKKSKSSKNLQAEIQRNLRKKFAKSRSHQQLKERVDALEKELGEIRRMLGESGGKTQPAPKKAAAKKSRASTPKESLQRIKGIGAVIEKRLRDYGVDGYAQIAAWNDADVEDFSQRLNFKGRIQRERWVEQAKALMSGTP